MAFESDLDQVAKKLKDFNTDSNSRLDAVASALAVFNTPLTVRVDVVVDATYVGEANAGTTTSTALWRIKKVVDTLGDIVVTWADSNANFDNVWDDHLTLTYG